MRCSECDTFSVGIEMPAEQQHRLDERSWDVPILVFQCAEVIIDVMLHDVFDSLTDVCDEVVIIMEPFIDVKMLPYVIKVQIAHCRDVFKLLNEWGRCPHPGKYGRIASIFMQVLQVLHRRP